MEAMAVLEKQQQFDFQNNGIEVMNFETLQRTYKENDIYGKPVQGIYHYQVLQRMMDICEKYNLDYEVEEIFAAQNRKQAAKKHFRSVRFRENTDYKIIIKIIN